MCLSQNNNKVFMAIVLGIFLASGCSGHSVKYGANSEGEGYATEEEMTTSVDSMSNGTPRYAADGSLIDGGVVDGTDPSLSSDQGKLSTKADMESDMALMDGTSSVPGGGANYGQQYDGVDGSGPNHGGVTGFGNGTANATNPDPETWANAYLQDKRSNPEFYGNPSNLGTSSSEGNGTSMNNGGSGSAMEADPEKWARAYVEENGGPNPEYVNPDMGIALANENTNSPSMGIRDSTEEYLNMSKTSRGVDGHVQDIYFEFDSWSISVEGAKLLEEDAKWLHANPGKALTIEGHCDQRGTQDYNLVLGKKRAEAAREYLVNLGVQSHRLKIVSYGKERPFCQNNNENCFKENRRNHMVIRMNQS